jgi:dephospho-CoA kinase
MALYYITGISGSGKSSVRNELLKRGYEVLGTDEDALAYFYHNETGEAIKNDVSSEERTPEWRKNHTWKLLRSTVEDLVPEAQNETVFLCGTTANDADEFWDLFTKVFALTINEDVLRDRIITRTTNDFGKSSHEMASVMEWQRTAEADYKKLGAVIIDATQPINQVVDDILIQIDR